MAVFALWQNSYWQRVCVVQKVVMAPSATVLYGCRSMDRDTFCRCMNALSQLVMLPHVIQPLPINWQSLLDKPTVDAGHGTKLRIMGRGPTRPVLSIRDQAKRSLGHWRFSYQPMSEMSALRSGRIARLDIKLSTVLSATSNHLSTDPRDKIFALLGVADTSGLSITPDYTISYTKVCARLTISYLTSRRDLAVFEDLYDPFSCSNASYHQGMVAENVQCHGGPKTAPAFQRVSGDYFPIPL